MVDCGQKRIKKYAFPSVNSISMSGMLTPSHLQRRGQSKTRGEKYKKENAESVRDLGVLFVPIAGTTLCRLVTRYHRIILYQLAG